MTRKKTYRSNKGVPIDMEAMRTANGRTVAAGNMGVNAKGDVVKGGQVVVNARDRVAPSYEKVTQTAQGSLKKPLTKDDSTIKAPAKKVAAPIEAEMTTETTKTRDDGSKYTEVMTPDGDIEVKEVVVTPKATTKAKPSKKTKRPSV